MSTSKKAAPKKAAPKKKSTRGGFREGAGGVQLVPNKVRKTIDVPQEVADKIIKSGSDVSSYMRIATYNQMVLDGLLTKKRGDELTKWKKKAA